MQITANSGKSSNPMLLVYGFIAVVIFYLIIVFANNYQPTALEARISATDGQGGTLTIKAVKEDGGCNYKAWWNTGDQIGSGFPQPCSEEGFQNYLKHLKDSGKITPEFYELLKTAKLW